MSFLRHEPFAITGMGLICRRFQNPAVPGVATPRARFIPVEFPAVPAQYVRQMTDAAAASRAIALAFGAAVPALNPAETSRDRCGVAITVSKGLTDVMEASVERMKASRGVLSDERIPTMCEFGADAAALWIARELKLGGPAAAVVAACASGLASIKLGMDWLRDGVCDSVLAGAAESSNSELVLRSFERLGVISSKRCTRPFDAQRDGFLVGEGSAVFRIERLESARRTGAEIFGTIAGIALGADAHHLTTPDPHGTVLTRAVASAIERAGLDPEQIGWVHAHGTATAYNDPVEMGALRGVFGKRIPPVTATKGMTGHLLGASGAVALALTLEALRGGFIPPIEGLTEPAECFADIDFVIGTPRVSTAKNALVLNHGFGGHIAAAVVSV